MNLKFYKQTLLQKIYSEQRKQKNSSRISKAGDISKKLWGWNVQRGENTARTWTTNSGLPGHKKRILIDKADNRLSLFNEDGTEVVRIDDSPADFGLTSAAVFGNKAPLVGMVGQPNGILGNMGWFVGRKMTRFVTIDTDDFNSCKEFASYGPQNILLQRTSALTTVYNGYMLIQAAEDLTGNRLYSIPDAGANADFVMTKGTQTIDSHKTIKRLSFNEVNIATVTAETTLTISSKQIQFLTAGTTAQKINMPTPVSCTGYMFIMFNTGTATLTLYPGPYYNISGGKGALTICNGTDWKAFGQ